MLLAELAILRELDTIRIVLLVLVGAVVAVLALRASQRDVSAHADTLLLLRFSRLSPGQNGTI